MNANGTVLCTNCSKGYIGPQCENCDVGYYKNSKFECKKCNCSGLGNSSYEPQICNPYGGQCYHCLNNTSGRQCEECKDGYYRQELKGDRKCVPCNCNGNEDKDFFPVCDRNTGVCLHCMYNASGNYCEKCALGYFGDAINLKNCTKIPNGKGMY